MRVEVDAHEECTPGWKFNHYEMLGVPLRVEIGPKEAKGKSVTIVSRIDGKKETVKLAGVEKTVCKKLDDAQKVMLEHAKKTQQTNDVGGMSELKNIIGTKGGFVRVGWCGGKECADWIKSETKGGEIIGTLHGKSEKPAGKVGKCIYCGKKAEHVVYVANMY
jgi:prolyl-tRNA synthetase